MRVSNFTIFSSWGQWRVKNSQCFCQTPSSSRHKKEIANLYTGLKSSHHSLLPFDIFLPRRFKKLPIPHLFATFLLPIPFFPFRSVINLRKRNSQPIKCLDPSLTNAEKMLSFFPLRKCSGCWATKRIKFVLWRACVTESFFLSPSNLFISPRENSQSKGLVKTRAFPVWV